MAMQQNNDYPQYKAKNRETNPHNWNDKSSDDKAQILDEPHIWGTKLEFKLFTKD
jgi:hypothetical protein